MLLVRIRLECRSKLLEVTMLRYRRLETKRKPGGRSDKIEMVCSYKDTETQLRDLI